MCEEGTRSMRLTVGRGACWCSLVMSIALVAVLRILVGQAALGADAPVTTQPSAATAARSGVDMGLIAYKLTDPSDLKRLLGEPLKQEKKNDGDGQALMLEYPGVEAMFVKPGGDKAPFTLWHLTVDGQDIDIGEDGIVVLRNGTDLYKLDHFWGVANASLIKVDLRSHLKLLDELPFDSRTVWPAADKLPQGFDPARLLEDGKNPGLGVRGLHKQGIDGRGIHIAIIDQPLLREHVEYKDRVVSYEAIDVDGAPPQMHGPPVTSIAVGKNCGVAPKASVHYYAVPTWKWWDMHCKPYAELLDKIVDRNERAQPGERVRVVSLSLGAFSQWPDHVLWEKAVERAAQEGVLVVTCDQAYLKTGTLKRLAGKGADDPAGYQRGLYGPLWRPLLIPAGNRTTASHAGPEVYTFWREGGMSWTVPYLAGVAALGIQVDPEIKPPTLMDLLKKTVRKTDAGLVVDPPAFIERVRKARGGA